MSLKRKFFTLLIVFALSLFGQTSFVLPASAADEGLTPAQVDKLVVDPQSFILHRDMTWHDLRPNPVIDWGKELNTESLEIITNRMSVKGRKINGGMIFLEFLGPGFISGQPRGSDPLGFKRFKTELVGEEGKKHGSYEEWVSRNPLISVLDYPEAYPNGYEDLPKYWMEWLNTPNVNDPKKPINHGQTVDLFWLENSFGKWGVDLKSHGIYTVPYFEFEFTVSSTYQSYADVPPSFRYVTPGTLVRDARDKGFTNARNSNRNPGGNTIRSTAMDTHFVEVAKRGGIFGKSPVAEEADNPWGIPETLKGKVREGEPVNFAEYDFFYWVHSGYGESGVWQEFGQLQYPTRQDIPWDIGPGPTLLMVEDFFNDNPEWIPVYAERYKDGWANSTEVWHLGNYNQEDPRAVTRVASYRTVEFWKDTLNNWRIKYDNTHPLHNSNAAFVFKLPQEDWDWANSYHRKKADEGRPVDVGIVEDGKTDYVGNPVDGNTRYVEFTAWLSAVAEWNHSTSATAGPGYGRTGRTHPIDAGTTSYPYGRPIPGSCQGENSGMGTFAHEFGHVADISDNYGNPWGETFSPRTEPWELMSRGCYAGPFGDHARWAILCIEGYSHPTNATTYPKNIWNFYDPGDILEVDIKTLAASTPLVANVSARNVPLTSALYPSIGVPRYNPATGQGFVKAVWLNFDSTAAAEFGDKSARTNDGYTNFHQSAASGNAKRMGIEVVQQTGWDRYNHDEGVLLTRAWNLTNAGWSVIDSHLYNIGMTDFFLNGEVAEYPIAHSTQLADAIFKAGKALTDTGYYREIRDAGDNIIKPGSEWRWEPRNDRPIVAGDSVNEWRDEANKLNFYILEKHLNPAKYGDFLSYKVAVRHDNGTPVSGKLNLSVKSGSEATKVQVGNYTKQTYLLTNTGATATDIVKVELIGKLAEGRFETEVVDLTSRGPLNPTPVPKSTTREIPKFFSEQNAVLLNDIYSIAPGETVEFDVYIKQIDENTMGKLADLLTVRVFSETNDNNFAMLSVNGKKDDDNCHKQNFREWWEENGCNAGISLLAVVLLAGFMLRRKS